MIALYRLFMNEWVIVSAILANSIILFILGFEELGNVDTLTTIDHFFTIFFWCEILVKSRAFGWKKYISDPWNRFDFFLVLISSPALFEMFLDLPDLSYLLVFRLLRVLRILRFMRFIPNIRTMIAGIQRAIRASVFIFVALLIYDVLLAILSSHLFRTDAPHYFGNPLISLYSIFQIFTLEGWNDIPNEILANTDPNSMKAFFTRFYFLLVVLTSGMFGFSIVNAIFVDEMVADNNNTLESKVDHLTKMVDQLLKAQSGKDQSDQGET